MAKVPITVVVEEETATAMKTKVPKNYYSWYMENLIRRDNGLPELAFVKKGNASRWKRTRERTEQS